MKSNFFLVEINSQRQQFKSCLLCFKDFSVMTKEHQCKRCKRAVCDKCAQNKMIILGYSKSKDPHRVCNACKTESDMLKQFVKTNSIQFNRDSIGIEWLQNLGVDLRSIKDQYRLRESRDQMEYTQFMNQVDSVYDEIEKKMNYSIREFFSLINIEKQQALTSLRNVLGTFLRNNPEVGFHPSLIFLTLIFLGISTEQITYVLLEQLYTKIIPKYLHHRSLRLGYEFKSELTLILNSFHNLKIPSEQIKPFLQDIGPYIVSLTVNAFEIQSTLFILSQLFQEDGYHEFVKALACALSTHQFKDGQQHKVFLMWNVREQNFQKYYYDLKKMRSNSSSTIRSVSLSEQQQQQEQQNKQQLDQLKQESTQLKQEQQIDKMKIIQQRMEIDRLTDQISELELQFQNYKQQFIKIEQDNQNLLEQNQNLKLQLMKQGNDSSSFTQSTKSDTNQLENELLKCKQEIEVLKLQNNNPNQMTQLVKIKNEQIARLTQEKAELEKRIEDLEEPKISKRTSSVAQINSVIKDLEDGKNLLEKKNQEILYLKKQLQEVQVQSQRNSTVPFQQQLAETASKKSEVIEDSSNKDLQLLIQDIDPAKKTAARNLKQLINKQQEEIIYYKTQAELKKEQVEPLRQKSESLQKQLDFLVEQNKELQIEIEHKQDLIQELEKKKMKASVEPRPQIVDDHKVLNENKQSCAAASDCIIF